MLHSFDVHKKILPQRISWSPRGTMHFETIFNTYIIEKINVVQSNIWEILFCRSIQIREWISTKECLKDTAVEKVIDHKLSEQSF